MKGSVQSRQKPVIMLITSVYAGLISIIYPLTNNASLSLRISLSLSPPSRLSRALSSPGPKTPVRFFREAPKIYEMCLHVPLRERGCRGGIARTERAGGTHAFSLRESALFLQTTDGRSGFSSSAPAGNKHILCRIVFWETKLFSSLSWLFSPHRFVTVVHDSLRDGPLGLWEPSPLCSDLLW